MKKKTLKKFIFEEMEKKGYVLDQEVYKFLGREPDYYTVSVYKTEFENLRRYTEHFKDLPNKVISKGNRKYLLRNSMSEGLGWYKIPKVYYKYLKENNLADVVK